MARPHKYIGRTGGPGHYQYKYDKGQATGKYGVTAARTIARKTEVRAAYRPGRPPTAAEIAKSRGVPLGATHVRSARQIAGIGATNLKPYSTREAITKKYARINRAQAGVARTNATAVQNRAFLRAAALRPQPGTRAPYR